MDLPPIPLDELEVLALRLERCAERIDDLAGRTRLGVSATWRGESAERHRERVARHAADLTDLGGRLREAAALVRRLAATAGERLALLAAAEMGTGGWP